MFVATALLRKIFTRRLFALLAVICCTVGSLFIITSCAPPPATEKQIVLPDETGPEVSEPPPALTSNEEEYLRSFEDPNEKAEEIDNTIAQRLFPFEQKVVPQKLLNAALAYYQANLPRITNKRYITIVDFSQHSSKTRLHVLDMSSGKIVSYHVAHGRGSDPDNDGYARRFSNIPNSKMSSVGFYLIASVYDGKHGASARLHGLSKSNSQAYNRAIVLHGAEYVREANVQQGRSLGCFTLSMSGRNKLIKLLSGGSLLYAGESR